MKSGTMGNMITDGVVPSHHNKFINKNKNKQPLENER